jgi:hypothetical protein
MVIMDGGQHGPPRREVWSYLQNPSALFNQASGESFCVIKIKRAIALATLIVESKPKDAFVQSSRRVKD